MPIKFFPHPLKIFHTHKNFCHVHETKLTHANKISHVHHEHIHTSPQHKFFTMPILPKSKPKLIQQHHNLPTLSKFHKPPTLSKLNHDKKNLKNKKMQHFKNAPKPTLQHDQSYNAPNSNNKMTMYHHQTFNEA